jgi:hypothetical protein
MKLAVVLTCLSLASLAAQTGPPSNPAANSIVGGSFSMTSVLPDLDRLQAAASQAALDIGHMRIEKWKADGESKRQAQSNADSVQRNLTSALPGLIEAVRAAPQDLTAEFKLYRNLNALYDVFGSLAESTGALGPRSDYDALRQQFQVIASVRRDLGDALEHLTASTQTELNQLRVQVRTLAQQQTAPAPPPKKVVVDDTAPAKTVHKKKKPPVTNNGSPSEASGSNSGNTTGTTPKS